MRKATLLILSVFLLSGLFTHATPRAVSSAMLSGVGDLNLTVTPHEKIKITSNSDFLTMAANEGWPGDGSEGDPIVISNLLFEGDSDQPVKIWDVDLHWRVEECVIQGSGAPGVVCGFWLEGTSNGEIYRCEVFGRHSPMYISDSTDIVVHDSIFRDNIGAATDGDAENILYDNCELKNNGAGPALTSFNNVTFLDCQLTGNDGAGIRLSMSSEVLVDSCNISDNDNCGIWNTHSSNVTIKDCMFSKNGGEGITMPSGSDCDVMFNHFVNNDEFGIKLGSSCDDCNITRNCFIDNGDSCQCKDDGSDNIFVHNYYSDWTSPDADSNEIVDEAYGLTGDSENSDPYPLTGPDVVPEVPSNLGTPLTIDPVLAVSAVGAVAVVIVVIIFIKRR